MTYEIEIQFTGWATKIVTVTAKDADEAKAAAHSIALETPSDELSWVLDVGPNDIEVIGE
jgi:hypothetical protein